MPDDEERNLNSYGPHVVSYFDPTRLLHIFGTFHLFLLLFYLLIVYLFIYLFHFVIIIIFACFHGFNQPFSWIFRRNQTTFSH